MSLFASDTFTDSDATLLENHVGDNDTLGWTKHPAPALSGSMDIRANRVRCSSNPVAYYASEVATKPSQYGLVGTFKALSLTASFAIAFHMDSVDDSCIRLRLNSAGLWTLFLRLFGVDSTLGTWQGSLTSGQTIVGQLQTVSDPGGPGPKVAAYVDDVLRIGPIYPGALSDAGHVGVFGGSTSSTNGGIHLASIYATEPSDIDIFPPAATATFSGVVPTLAPNLPTLITPLTASLVAGVTDAQYSATSVATGGGTERTRTGAGG